MECNCVEQTPVVPKGHQNGICKDLVNNGTCRSIFKCDKEMQLVHNEKILHHMQTGHVYLKRIGHFSHSTVVTSQKQQQKKVAKF